MRAKLITTVCACGVAALVAGFAPEERALGAGIRAVYVHVSWVWAGLALALAFAFASISVAVVGAARFVGPLDRTYGAALLYLLLGLLASFVAAYVNWGMIVWQEPRTLAVIRIVLALAFAWVVTRALGGRFRIRLAALSAVVVACVGWLYVVPRVLHPVDPVQRSSSIAMQLTFYGLTGLWLALAAVWIWPRPDDSPDD